jgi:hypothetical protein
MAALRRPAPIPQTLGRNSGRCIRKSASVRFSQTSRGIVTTTVIYSTMEDEAREADFFV